MSFNERLKTICQQKNSHVCVGLDVELEKMPPFIRQQSDPLFEFCKSIIDATIDFVAAYKINTAFFEAYGVAGWQALKRVANYLPSHVLRIADAKRADIGNSSRMYARAFLIELPFDAVTVNPYLGFDSISPFIENREKGAFILALTSNVGASDFQYLTDNGVCLYERVAMKILKWNKDDNCGVVVGATHPEEIARIRRLAPGIPFLIPGVGAQGGDLTLAVRNAIPKTDDSAIFNSSRGIIFAGREENFAERASQNAKALRDTINQLKPNND